MITLTRLGAMFFSVAAIICFILGDGDSWLFLIMSWVLFNHVEILELKGRKQG